MINSSNMPCFSYGWKFLERPIIKNLLNTTLTLKPEAYSMLSQNANATKRWTQYFSRATLRYPASRDPLEIKPLGKTEIEGRDLVCIGTVDGALTLDFGKSSGPEKLPEEVKERLEV
ncbi:11334_t:CDS:2 [Acaulospora colombiana]|uniref:11334_t:CDS:1 n=1 Tax=Acaulospora colombiana TaxID=27376 RepID=A0ACA9L5W1_9GLOM|nr:11334_t:CDS:2 [Acaulospora colombiana]